jgi:26S proteasome regulatory subunit N9
MQDQVETWLKAQQKQAAHPEYQEIYKTFLDLYDKKLWHQLTLAIEDKFINLENSSALLIPLYENFIKSWEGKMNKIALMRFVARASR